MRVISETALRLARVPISNSRRPTVRNGTIRCFCEVLTSLTVTEHHPTRTFMVNLEIIFQFFPDRFGTRDGDPHSKRIS